VKKTEANCAGSPHWIAPELVRKGRGNTKIDVYSVGCVLLEMIASTPPYYGLSAAKVMFITALRGPPPLKNPQNLSPTLRHLLSECLILDPEARPPIYHLLKHEFFLIPCPIDEIVSTMQLVFMSKALKLGGF